MTKNPKEEACIQPKYRMLNRRYLVAGSVISITAGSLAWYQAGKQDQNSPPPDNSTTSTDSPRNVGMPPTGPSLDAEIIVRWRFEGFGYINGPPVIQDGVVYLGSGAFAIDRETGHELWHAPITMEALHSPVVAGDLMLLTSQMSDVGGIMQAFDIHSGLERWSYGGGDGLHMGSPAVTNGAVYVCNDRTLYELDLATGTVRREVWQAVSTVPPVIVDGVMFIHGFTSDYSLIALDLATGTERWAFPTSSDPARQAMVTIDRGTVYTTTESGQLYALDAQTGDAKWHYDRGAESRAVPRANGDLVVTDGAGSVIALDVVSGAERWTFSAETDTSFFSLAVTDQVVYASSREHLFALDAATGDEYWRLAVSSSLPMVTVGEGMVFVASDSMNLIALGNLPASTLVTDVIIRGTPSPTGLERGTATAGTIVERVGDRSEINGTIWVEVTIGDMRGWILLDAIDPATLPSEGELEYVFIPGEATSKGYRLENPLRRTLPMLEPLPPHVSRPVLAGMDLTE